jgi:hypothetical protein
MISSEWDLDFSISFDLFDGFNFENKKLIKLLHDIEIIVARYKIESDEGSVLFRIANVTSSNSYIRCVSGDGGLVFLLKNENFRNEIIRIIPRSKTTLGAFWDRASDAISNTLNSGGVAVEQFDDLNPLNVLSHLKYAVIFLQLSLLISGRLDSLDSKGVDMSVFRYGLNLQNDDKNRGGDRMSYENVKSSYELWVLAGVIVFGIALALYKRRQVLSKSAPNLRQSPVKFIPKYRYAIFCMKQQVAESNSIDLNSNESSTVSAIAKLADKSAFGEYGIDELNGLKETRGVDGYVVMFVKDTSGVCKSLDEGTLVASAEQFLEGEHRTGDVIIYQNVSRDGLMNAGVQLRTRLN